MTQMFDIEVYKNNKVIFSVSADMSFFNNSSELLKNYVNGEIIKLRFYFVEDKKI
jgi:hypothetical protein